MEYASGIDYKGMWRRGKRHGQGVLMLPSGVVYDGQFFAGRQHGRGNITSPQTGFHFTGTFQNGFIGGPGRLTRPDGKTDTRDFSSWVGGMTFKGLIDMLHRELEDDTRLRTEERDATFSVRLAVRLVDHVEEIRQEIREERK